MTMLPVLVHRPPPIWCVTIAKLPIMSAATTTVDTESTNYAECIAMQA